MTDDKLDILLDIIAELGGTSVSQDDIKKPAKKKRIRPDEIESLLTTLAEQGRVEINGESISLITMQSVDEPEPISEHADADDDEPTPFDTEPPIDFSNQHTDDDLLEEDESETQSPEEIPVQPPAASRRSFGPPKSRGFSKHSEDDDLEGLDPNQTAKSIEELIAEREQAAPEPSYDTEDANEVVETPPPPAAARRSRFDPPKSQDYGDDNRADTNQVEDTSRFGSFKPQGFSKPDETEQEKPQRFFSQSNRQQPEEPPRRVFGSSKQSRPSKHLFQPNTQASGLDALDEQAKPMFGPGSRTNATSPNVSNSAPAPTERIVASYDIELPIDADENWIDSAARTIRKLNTGVELTEPNSVVVLRISVVLPVNTPEDIVDYLNERIEMLKTSANLDPNHTRVELKTQLS